MPPGRAEVKGQLTTTDTLPPPPKQCDDSNYSERSGYVP